MNRLSQATHLNGRLSQRRTEFVNKKNTRGPCPVNKKEPVKENGNENVKESDSENESVNGFKTKDSLKKRSKKE